MAKTLIGSIATTFVKNQIGKKLNSTVGILKERCQLIKDSLQPIIDINSLKRLHNAGNICNIEYTEELDQQLQVPDEIKNAWKNFSDTKKVYEEVLAKYDIKL